MRWASNGRRDWRAAVLMLVVALCAFVLLRLASPASSVPACALAGAAIGVALVLGGKLAVARLRGRPARDR